MDENNLAKTVARLMSPPKGILAIDESLPTCNKRFEKLGVPLTEEKRREYRELLITTPEIFFLMKQLDSPLRMAGVLFLFCNPKG